MRHLLIALLCLLPACGTIMNRGPFFVPVDSVPPGATVSYVDANVGVTPCTVAMTTYCSQVVLTMPGYHPQIANAGRGINGWVLGNFLFGGIIGLAVDGASGSSGTIATSPMYVEMTPLTEPRPDVWVRPPSKSMSGENDDEGWITAGQPPAPPPSTTSLATRAPAWKPPTPRVVESDY